MNKINAPAFKELHSIENNNILDGYMLRKREREREREVHLGRRIRIAIMEKDSSYMIKYSVCMFVSSAGL